MGKGTGLSLHFSALPSRVVGLKVGACSRSRDRKGQVFVSELHCGLLLADAAYWPLGDRHPNTGSSIAYVCEGFLDTSEGPSQDKVPILFF